jgi:ligand-binding sensor domain-containing protein
MRAWVIGLGVMMLLGDSLDVYALDGHRRITQYAQSHFGARDGLPHNLVDAIAQTPDGYLWTASDEGLSRFDGAAFTNFDHQGTAGVPSNRFTALAVDAAGTLWAGTRDRGLLHLVEGEFRRVTWEPGSPNQQIYALTFDSSGDLWIGMRARGVVRLHAGVLVAALTTHDGLPSDDVRTLYRARDGAMWIGTFHGLAQWKVDHLVRGPAALDGTAVHAITQDAHGDLWCATDKGIAHLHDDAVDILDEKRLSATAIQSVLFDRDGNLWFGTGAGVARMTFDHAGGFQIERLPSPDVLILALFEDSDGNLWIGSERGLDRLHDGDVVPFGAGEGLTDDVVLGFQEDPTGARWLTTSGGLYRVEPGETAATRIAGPRGGAMFAIFPDSHGNVWFGSRNGDVGRWHDGQLTWLGKARWEGVRAIHETADGMWIGTGHGLFRMHGDQLSDAEAILEGVALFAIIPGPDGSLWLATQNSGLLRWRAGTLAEIPPHGPPHDTMASTIMFDPDGTMWVGTQGAGLWRLRHGRWVAFTIKDGMFDDVVWRILDDGLGNLWMSSNRGIWRVSRDQLEAYAVGGRRTIDSVVYGEADGMRDRECNGGTETSGWRTRDGWLWFPTVRGMVAIDPSHLRPGQPPRAVLETVRIDGQSQRMTSRLTLPAGGGRLELGYTSPLLRGHARLRFRYRLDGFDSDWNEAGPQRIAQYTNLPPGDYRFVVEAGLDDKWGSAASVTVTLPPRFYQTGWFYALALLSLVVAIIAVPLMRVRRLRVRARELDQRVQAAIGELKVLSGLLPICGWCKKIREDRGCWSKIEAYLSTHTDARFAHGICPECTDKMLIEERFGPITSQETHPPQALTIATMNEDVPRRG